MAFSSSAATVPLSLLPNKGIVSIIKPPSIAVNKQQRLSKPLRKLSPGYTAKTDSDHKSRVSSGVKCEALRDDTQQTGAQVYQGVYGPWTVDSSDIREVLLYRSGLVATAVSFVIAASPAFLPDGTFLNDIVLQNADIIYAIGAGGLGLSLILIHIYVTPIKRALQVFWALGILGSLGAYLSLSQPSGESLILYVINNPISVWFVGPLFVALTGLVFKEGLCYGKLEAGILTFVIPTLLLGHLSGLMDENAELGLLGFWMVLFIVFATRKFTQPIKDDIGDKSVFMFNALPEEDKKVVLKKLEEQTGQGPI
ncbi:uncharacterized protein LOC18434326 [Amborella trichopoda]|uniref:Uncharacterized protein n=1 Tax=Amborella trichopoda TaxID=13333 RepID=W1PES6_AMBTC|nr:uncharacterized protein LOC18434326 [Amborella trichopoda]ERN06136.1 hypothetical protein AMTR_s00016p00087320 [Amborella trichopoda]|eukprot:XP_006844461.1 uncharacterized protein LOC18434326 [Amborella trichopoda]